MLKFYPNSYAHIRTQKSLLRRPPAHRAAGLSPRPRHSHASCRARHWHCRLATLSRRARRRGRGHDAYVSRARACTPSLDSALESSICLSACSQRGPGLERAETRDRDRVERPLGRASLPAPPGTPGPHHGHTGRRRGRVALSARTGTARTRSDLAWASPSSVPRDSVLRRRAAPRLTLSPLRPSLSAPACFALGVPTAASSLSRPTTCRPAAWVKAVGSAMWESDTAAVVVVAAAAAAAPPTAGIDAD